MHRKLSGTYPEDEHPRTYSILCKIMAYGDYFFGFALQQAAARSEGALKNPLEECMMHFEGVVRRGFHKLSRIVRGYLYSFLKISEPSLFRYSTTIVTSLMPDSSSIDAASCFMLESIDSIVLSVFVLMSSS